MTIISTDTLQLAHIKETTAGVTPATPAFKLWRTTGEGLTFAPNVSDDQELGGGTRTRRPGDVTGATVSGDINFQLARFDALEEAIEGVLAGIWGECPLSGAPGGAIDSSDRVTVGRDIETFTIEKRFPNPNNTPGAMDIAAAVGSLGATVDITMSGGPAVGSGVVEVTLAQDDGVESRFRASIAPGDTDADAATALAAVIDAHPEYGATAATTVVTVTPTGAAMTTALAQAGTDEYQYQRYRGCSYSIFTVTTSPNERVTGNVSIVGGVPDISYLTIPGATYVSAGSGETFRAPEVLELNMGASLGVLTNCWSSLTITLDSANRPIPCIGSLGDRQVVPGQLNASISGDVYFTDQGILEALISNESIGAGNVTFANADDEIYRFDFFDLKVTAGQVVADSTDSDLTMPLEFMPTPVKVCDDGAGNDWAAGLIISKVNTAPTLP